jgi:predicted nucleic acid-binding protein
MIVADTSALISLATADTLNLFLEEFEVHTTETVVDELENTAEYDDSHGDAAETVLANLDWVSTHDVKGDLESSRVDQGEGSCALLTKEIDAEFLITDDLRALPELQTVADSKVAISPIVLKALVQRDVLEPDEALENLDRLAERRDWLGAPIFRRAQNLFGRE